MNFLTLLGFKKAVDETAKVLEFPKPKAVAPMHTVASPKEHYRVGFISETGMTTLTMMSNDGWGSITLSMNRPACEQLIKMLRATYPDDEDDIDPDDPDGGLHIPEEETKVKVA